MRIAVLSLLAACSALAKAGPDTATKARLLPDDAFDVRLVETAECPPAFGLELARDLPHPGWGLRVDRVARDADARRATIDVTAFATDGIFAQVVTRKTVVADLKSLRKGTWTAMLRFRDEAGTPYRLVQAAVLVAE